MEQEFTKTIEYIMECLINGEYKAFFSDKEKFHFIDKEKNIDFQITLGNHNYLIRDNATDRTYIATRKHIGDGAFFHQVILSNKTNEYYISFFAKDNMPGLIKMISKDEKGALICDNPDCLESMKDNSGLLNYVNAFFEEELEQELEDEEMYLNIDNQSGESMNPSEKSMLDLEKNEYNEDFSSELTEEFSAEESEEFDEEEEEDLFFQNEFRVVVNGTEITGERKIKVISSCAIDLVNRYNRYRDMEIVILNLKNILEDMKKEMEQER